jgi:hypothetical protein
MLDGWKLVIGSILAAVAQALLTVDFSADKPNVIAGKLLLAAATALVGIGVAGKADKMTAAMSKPAELVVTTQAVAKKLTDAEKIAAYDAAHPSQEAS